MKLALALLCLTALTTAAQAAEPRHVVVKAIDPRDCNTDGGGVSCGIGHHFIAQALMYRFGPYGEPKIDIACGDAKKGSYTFDLIYEYNDGMIIAPESTDKKLAKAPACVREELMKVAPPIVLEIWKKVWALDPTIDVRTTFRFKVGVE